ncbi:type II toxin-antitoxin system VapC family toxin [Akkermansiaceae bacterium]|nr:type II toxin-antitoxin system VapC family toxin [Akkermansiaceae bacterium]
MKVLIDTQIILWVLMDSARLTSREKEILNDEQNEIFCYPISFFEISLKFSLGKLDLQGCEPQGIPALMEEVGFLIEVAEPAVFASCHQLPRGIHKDPFDRLLIWHCMSKDYHLLSRDRMMGKYAQHGLKVL